MSKKVHFEPASNEELSIARRDLAQWFAELAPELRAEIEALAAAADAEAPLASAPRITPARKRPPA